MGSQDLSLGSQCNFMGIIIHELMHALGFLHEQSRQDRDRYVKVNTANIKPGNLHLHLLFPQNTLHIKYLTQIGVGGDLRKP